MLPSHSKANCYGCEDRHVGCHAECEKYRAWRSDLDEYKSKVWKKQFPEIVTKSYIHAKSRKER